MLQSIHFKKNVIDGAKLYPEMLSSLKEKKYDINHTSVVLISTSGYVECVKDRKHPQNSNL